MHEFDAAAVRADIADYGGEIDLAKTGTDFELDGIADAELARRLQISAAQADGFYASEPRWRSLDLGTQRGVQGNSGIAARDDVAGTGLPWRSKGGRGLLERGTILDQR